jgi:hypothetical protein
VAAFPKNNCTYCTTMSNSPGLSAVSTAPPPFGAIEAAALAAALAENALESERKERTVGPFEHTPQHLYGVDDPCFGFVESSWSCAGGGDWGGRGHSSS